MRQSIEADICIGLQKALSYLEQSFNFSSDTTASVLQTLSLKCVVNFGSLSETQAQVRPRLRERQCDIWATT